MSASYMFCRKKHDKFLLEICLLGKCTTQTHTHMQSWYADIHMVCGKVTAFSTIIVLPLLFLLLKYWQIYYITLYTLLATLSPLYLHSSEVRRVTFTTHLISLYSHSLYSSCAFQVFTHNLRGQMTFTYYVCRSMGTPYIAIAAAVKYLFIHSYYKWTMCVHVYIMLCLWLYTPTESVHTHILWVCITTNITCAGCSCWNVVS